MEFKIEKNEMRPCYVDGERAMFHKWIIKETNVLTFEKYFNVKDRQAIVENYQEAEYLPNGAYINKLTATLGLVELESGQVATVLPQQIRFIDTAYYIEQYAFE